MMQDWAGISSMSTTVARASLGRPSRPK